MSTAVIEFATDPDATTEQQQQQPPKPANPPDLALTQMILGSLNAQAVYVAAKLGVADSLAAGSKRIDHLAKEVGADESSLYRVMRALASVGVFAEERDRTF